jgi:hypothetical protein
MQGEPFREKQGSDRVLPSSPGLFGIFMLEGIKKKPRAAIGYGHNIENALVRGAGNDGSPVDRGQGLMSQNSGSV